MTLLTLSSMGRTKTKTKRKDTRRISTPDISAAASSRPSAAALFEKAQSLVEQCDYELAAKFLKRVIETDGSHTQAKELFGVVLLELGDLENAQELFHNLISSNSPPSVTASAHLHLAQLCENPREALDHYQKAVDTLYNSESSLFVTQGQSDDLQSRTTIAKALVAMTEIWLTDLCMEPEAEQNCESLLNLAIQADPENIEVLQSLASVRMSQQKPEDAKSLVEKSWSLWKELPAGDPSTPVVPTRLSLTRLMLELSMYKEALTVLTGIIETDDQEVEAWYLEGWCFLLMSEDAKARGAEVEGLSWNELAQDARDCLDTCITLFGNQNHPDTAMLSHAHELVKQLQDMGVKSSNLDPGDDEEWEDVEGSEDEDTEMAA